mmetsp:Transcript_11059/g.13829  ORF Transcript_11059/g.13829 Transcript_11059/m.13829 type:complete len:179 (+) Transcript_11059:381-917(+)|eukprot:CAMPEP_0204844260 /NCGR_PEP_ID=MMETSP1347-20130617/88_1 /ASSEMBLY_ACC=CAM_ASM_000690 /TAXON_ID=215587 /ORGANISM="Aplanochytrium stocchinoi, Strain GSBS06" /LENGTH=178 /DNA_ID=CAMNT_0051983569 /DNA_START=172 /DNA_END=708 /DNA_ORIENTATION=+
MPKDTELHKSAYKGDRKKVASLLEEDPKSVNEEGAGGRTALHRAVSGNKQEVVELLLSHNANANATDASGRTPLHWAAICNAVQCAEMLVQGGADINFQTKVGATPLHFAAEGAKTDMVSWLCTQENIDLQATDNAGMTAYDLAKQEFKRSKDDVSSHKQNLKLLRPAGSGKGCFSCF